MNFYTPERPPKSGNAKKIWKALHDKGFKVKQLHYNPNCWGRGSVMGYGTWAFEEQDRGSHPGYWCGITVYGVYVKTMAAPYTTIYISEGTEKEK